MTNPSSLFRKSLLAGGLLCLTPVLLPQSARAGDKEFGVLVHYVESHYKVHRQYRFILSFASFAVNIARPYGVKGMKLAIFENEKISAANADDQDFPSVVKAGLAEGWQPMVRVWSRRNGERTVIFAKPEGKNMKLLIASVEQNEAVVIQVKVNPDKLSQCIDRWSREDRNYHDGDKKDTHPPSSDDASSDVAQVKIGM